MALMPMQEYVPYKVIHAESGNTTWKAKLDAMYSYYSGLSDDEKVRSAILVDGKTVLRFSSTGHYARYIVCTTGVTMIDAIVANNDSHYYAMKCWTHDSTSPDQNTLTDNTSSTVNNTVSLVVFN